MTQYYETEANELERQACLTNNHAEQSRLWAEASRIGTVVQWCDRCGQVELYPKGRTGRCDECLRDPS